MLDEEAICEDEGGGADELRATADELSKPRLDDSPISDDVVTVTLEDSVTRLEDATTPLVPLLTVPAEELPTITLVAELPTPPDDDPLPGRALFRHASASTSHH